MGYFIASQRFHSFIGSPSLGTESYQEKVKISYIALITRSQLPDDLKNRHPKVPIFGRTIPTRAPSKTQFSKCSSAQSC